MALLLSEQLANTESTQPSDTCVCVCVYKILIALIRYKTLKIIQYNTVYNIDIYNTYIIHYWELNVNLNR